VVDRPRRLELLAERSDAGCGLRVPSKHVGWRD
jgi:hypothetical protein